MAPARAALESALASVKITAPRVPVWSNVTASPFPSDPDAIRQLLARQLVDPVQWEATLAALAAAPGPAEGASEPGAPRVLHELGPGQQIKSMVRRVSAEAWRGMVNAGAA
jgi:[acyl-carrier-protein] S-malonyltransferase